MYLKIVQTVTIEMRDHLKAKKSIEPSRYQMCSFHKREPNQFSSYSDKNNLTTLNNRIIEKKHSGNEIIIMNKKEKRLSKI